MSVVRSVSASRLSSGPLDLEVIATRDLLHQDQSRFPKDASYNNKSHTKIYDILTSKAQTLDRFSRLSSFSQHGEKRKKSFFASFRLNKKSFGKEKEDKESSGSDLSQSSSPMKIKDNSESSSEKINPLKEEVDFTKPTKRYLNRVSSFVNRVATKVQGDAGVGLALRKNKLERSLTITGADLVSVDYLHYQENEVAVLTGIRNHGNTCFINAVIQCLSHTDVLAEYFVLDHYKNDLTRSNRINSKKFGTKGELTEHLALLLKALWVLRYSPNISLNLKNVIEKFETVYKGSNQHDAAEFLMFILDKVHEDLNTASKRKYKKNKNSYGRPDEVVAAEALSNHLRCNSSFIQDLFQAQFRSSLKCPHCLKESNTFDPYLCVSIPIPQKEILPLYVSVVYLNQQPKQVKIGISVDSSASIKDFRNLISTDCGICSDHLLITEVDGEGFHRTFSDNSFVSIIQTVDPIYAVELTPPPSSLAESEGTEFLHIVWMNVVKADFGNVRFGGVYQSHIARDISYSDLQKLLLKEMSPTVSNDTLISGQENGLFTIGVDIGTKTVLPLEPDLDLPLLHESVDEALSICHPLAGPVHVKLVLNWTLENKEKYILDDVDHMDEHSSVGELKEKCPEFSSVTLSECLQLHTSAELLSCGDAWHCPTCNRKQQVLKRLNLWSAPQVLVVHLKRFKQASLTNSSKLRTTVNFPLMGFDISDHMAGRSSISNASSYCSSENGTANKGLNGVWSPWKRQKKLNSSENENVYDLYAVCNHHGSDLQGGHYTAMCRNPTNGKWYSFDDFHIEEISPERVPGADAYILFYQKRSSSSVMNDAPPANHWSTRIPLSIIPSSLKSPTEKQEKDTSDIKPSSKDNLDVGCETSSLEHANEKETPSSPTSKELADTETCQENDFAKVIISENAKSYLTMETAQNDIAKLETSTNEVEWLSSQTCEPVDEEDEDETVPEVRIKPASLEVLASHKYKFCSSTQSVVKVTLPPEDEEISLSRTDSIASDVNDADHEAKINGCDESDRVEETPKVIIKSSSSASVIRRHRQNSFNNTNKTPSFITIRTPSPRLITDRSSAPSLCSRKSPSQTGLAKFSPVGDPKKKESRPSSYSGASVSCRTKPTYERAKKNHEKTRSFSCVMECKKSKSCKYDTFLSESSV